MAIRGISAKDVVQEIDARVRIPSAPPFLCFFEHEIFKKSKILKK